MIRLRLVLMLCLVAALDIAAPVVPSAMEVFEEFEASMHRGGGRQTVRLARDAAPPVATRDAAVTHAPPRPRLAAVARAPRGVDGPARKVPSPIPESASAPEDH